MTSLPPQDSPSPIPESQTLAAQEAPPRSAHTCLRNRRFAALRELLRAGDYFSEEQMRLRAPGLFHHYIGRFQQTPKQPQNHPRNPKNHPRNTPNPNGNIPNLLETPKNHIEIPRNDPKIPGNPKIAPNDPKTGATEILREILLKSLEENIKEEEEEEEEEDEDEEEEEEEEEERIPDEAEKELLRLEFTTRMYQSFLEGLDGDFDYSQVDENSDLDNLDILSRDLEEQYFDEEEPSEAPKLD